MAITPEIDDKILVKMFCDAVDKLLKVPTESAVFELCEAERLIVARFDPIARKHAYRRAAGRLDVDDIVQGFWDKVFADNILANYEARGDASLRNFLTGVLHHHIQDAFRKLGRRRTHAEFPFDQRENRSETDQTFSETEVERFGWVERKEPTEPSDKDLEDLPDTARPKDEVETAQLERLASQAVGKALDILTVCFPKDALLIQLHMDGAPNTKIINENLLDEPDLNTDALKKRSSRARKRFRIILTSLCLEEELSIQDLIKYFRGFSTFD